MKSWDCQYKYKHLNGIWYWYDMIFWKHIQVTCYHFWRSLGLFAPCANLVTFQNSYFNEHRADCKITDEHPMNFGDRYCVKTRWIFKTWWKPGEFSKPGENLVKTLWNVKTWWKPGVFTKFLKNYKIKNKGAFCTSEIRQKKRFDHFFGEIYPFWRWNWRQNINLVKTWWNLETWCKLGQLSRTWWMFRWNSGNFLDLMDFLKPGENSVKT